MRTFGWIFLAALWLALAQPRVAQGDEFFLVREGEPAATIVLPAETEFDRFAEERMATFEARLRQRRPDVTDEELAAQRAAWEKALETEKTRVGDEELLAARELQAVVKKISGVELTIVRLDKGAEGAATDGPTIRLGADLARAAGLREQLGALLPDGHLCTVRNDSLVLAGRRARGTLYAVYTFLESLGCRWVMPGPFGEIYPALDTVVTTIDTTENPSHSQRYFWCTYGHAPGYPRWSLRNRGNFVRALGDPVIAQGHALNVPLAWGAKRDKYAETVVVEVPEEKTAEDGTVTTVMVQKEVKRLPDEYFAMHGAEPAGNTPNMLNPKVWDLYADYYIDHFNRNPLAQYVSVSAADGPVRDDRAASERINSMEFDPYMGLLSATDRMWFFLNRVIEKVVQVHPERKFGVLVYSNNIMPPRVERVHPNMALVFAPLTICPLHHVRDEKCKTNRRYREWLEDWKLLAEAAGAESYYYDYEPTGFCWNMALICPRWGIIGKNYPWFHERGLDGHTTQGHDDWAACGLNNYLMQRLYWNAELDYKDVIADYARARFGAAADAMIEYYTALEQRMDEIPDMYSNEVWDNHLILTPELRERCREILAKAAELADTDRAKAHVETMLDLQRSTDAMCDAVELARATGDFAQAAQMMQECFAVRDKLAKLYPNFMNAHRTSPEQKAQYMTGGIYNQYLGFDERIKRAKESLLLPQHWKGMLDTRNHAQAFGYHRPKVPVETLDDLDVTVCPDVKYQTQREPAAFFYRTDVDVPQSFADAEKVTLFFPSVTAKAVQIWINGEPVEFDQGDYKDTTWRGPTHFWMDYDHQEEFDVTAHVKPGEKNTIAFRVYKAFAFGGTYRRIFLLAD